MQEVLKNKIHITEALDICLGKNVHFVAFRLPGEDRTSLIIQKDHVILPLSKLNQHLPDKGFLIAPFSAEKNEAWLIQPDIILQEPINIQQLEVLNNLPLRVDINHTTVCPEDTRKDDYIRLIHDSLENIRTGAFEKVVLSRVKSIKGNFRPRLTDIFHNLCNSYPQAFVYIFCINGQCWTGATPEPFICSHEDELKTVSLASTRPYSAKDMNIGNWNNKELEEQEYVTTHIEKTLKKFNILSYKKTGPFVARAGNLLHLRTDLTFSADTVSGRLPVLIASLHPTPAVCGMSTGKAMDFIKNSEKHNREYYAGFLGPVGFSDMISLYVNLRCLKVYDDRLLLFVGGGITRDSVPEEEWEETEIKADTLLSVIKEFS